MIREYRKIGSAPSTSGRLAQLGEHGVRNAGVAGSNPAPSTKLRLNARPATVPYTTKRRSVRPSRVLLINILTLAGC
jgi:hypothetical protein